jgi:hypothetical protein
MTWLKQDDALSLILLNIALEKLISSVQRNNRSVIIDEIILDVLGFADDQNFLGENKISCIKHNNIDK